MSHVVLFAHPASYIVISSDLCNATKKHWTNFRFIGTLSLLAGGEVHEGQNHSVCNVYSIHFPKYILLVSRYEILAANEMPIKNSLNLLVSCDDL